MGKKKGKHILMPPFSMDWPKVDTETENKIISALTLKLQEFPSLESKRTKDARIKSDKPAAVPRPELDKEEEEKLKARLRQQLVIGHRQVTKGLELDRLALVLVSGDAQPQVLAQSLLPLAANRQCPAVCFANLNLRLTDAIGVTSVLALGFKKAQPGEPDDFGAFVSMAVGLVPPLSVPWTSQCVGAANTTGGEDSVTAAEDESPAGKMPEGEETVTMTTAPAENWQLADLDQESEVMSRLLELVKPYTAALQKPRSKLTPEELQTRKTINSHMVVDLGALQTAAHGGLLDLLLVQHQGGVLHPMLVSAVEGARERGCPVLRLVSLKKGLSSVVRDSHLRAVGFKKTPAGAAQQPSEFREFVTMASQFAKTLHPSTATSEPKESSSGEATASGSGPKGKEPKGARPVYDVSSLYVQRKDEGTGGPDSGVNARKEACDMSQTFISLSSEPTVRYLGVKGQGGTAGSVPDAAYVDTSGCGTPGKKLASETTPADAHGGDSPPEAGSGAWFTGVMGLDSAHGPPAALGPAYPEPRPKRKVRVGLKRALDHSSERGEFVSFKIRPTSVQVSLPNPGKKKHKKFKKK